MTDTTDDLTPQEDEFYRMCVFSRKHAKDLQDHVALLLHRADNCKCKRESRMFRKVANGILDARKMFIEEYAEYLN